MAKEQEINVVEIQQFIDTQRIKIKEDVRALTLNLAHISVKDDMKEIESLLSVARAAILDMEKRASRVSEHERLIEQIKSGEIAL